MKVSLMSFTPDALTLLLATKGTRLAHDENPADWSDEKRAEHLAYMRDTIRSSWEFVNYVFKIEGVTRAFTHQLVRTRSGSYAQESQRTVDVRDHDVIKPQGVEGDAHLDFLWDRAADEAMDSYAKMIEAGAEVQDARGILPTAVSTSIIAQFNLRSLSDMAKTRLCTRTQGEYQHVFKAMRAAVCEVHPWAKQFIDVHCAAHGTCAFPRYGKTSCPLYKHVMPQEELEERRAAIRAELAVVDVAANPVSRDGKTM